MKKITFGNTGEKVSALSLGCMLFGTLVDEDTSFKLLDLYYERGGRFLDTANNYAFWLPGGEGGESERLLNKWMKERKNRDDLFICTKMGANPKDVQAVRDADGNLKPDWIDSWEGLTAESIKKAVDESLTRLGIDHIDMYLAHIDDSKTPLQETVRALDDLVKAGKVRHVGCSNYKTRRFQEARDIAEKHGLAGYSCIQQQFSYIRPNKGADFGINVHGDQELLQYCEDKNIPIMAYSPLLGGIYSDPARRETFWRWDQFKGPDTEARFKAIEEVANQLSVNPNQVVYAWMVKKKPTIIPIVASGSMDHMKDNLDAIEIELSDEVFDYLEGVQG